MASILSKNIMSEVKNMSEQNEVKHMSEHFETSGTTRRGLLKAVFVAPVILTLPAIPSFARSGSNGHSDDDLQDGLQENQGGQQNGQRRRRRHSSWWSIFGF